LISPGYLFIVVFGLPYLAAFLAVLFPSYFVRWIPLVHGAVFYALVFQPSSLVLSSDLVLNQIG